MKSMRFVFALTAGTSLVSSPILAQVQVQPTHPTRPQIQPTRPQPPSPVIQPPRPQPPRPVIQPPRPPHPIRPRPPIIVIPVWNYLNPGWAYGRAVLYSGAHYSGHYLTVRHNIPDLRQYGFNDRADSLHARGRWQICSKTRYRGRCATVRGSDPYLGRLTGEVSSIRYLGH